MPFGFIASAIGDVGSFLGGLSPTSLLGAANLGSSLIGANASQNAAQTQANAANQAAQIQQQMFNTQNAQQQPYRTAGYSSLNQLLGGLGGTQQQFTPTGGMGTPITGTGQFTQTFDPQQLASNLAPNYQFMLNQGLGATRQAANASGGGSNINQAATRFAEDYASNAYQNAFNNYQTQQSNIFNRLASIAGIGQTAQGQTQNLASNVAGNIGQAAIGGAQAQAAGQVGVANALGGGLQNLAGYNYLGSLTNPQTSGGGGQGYFGGISSPSNAFTLSGE